MTSATDSRVAGPRWARLHLVRGFLLRRAIMIRRAYQTGMTGLRSDMGVEPTEDESIAPQTVSKFAG
jgi:hypothetical protein